ncbi:MAG: SDR family oxidoreductase [Nocardioidaceae bacterium]|nr:SDR family oxidoreductase [Nocardioidaceae bacterium]
MSELTGKVALVTGGSRGIGAAIAVRLAHEGAHVALTYHRAADQAAVVVGQIESAGRRGVAIAADSADPDAVTGAVAQTVAEFGRLDVLVNNAGVFPTGPLQEVTLAELDHAIAVHIRAVFLASQAAAGHMGDSGRIISIGSCFAERVPYAGISLYTMTKSALLGLTKGLARDLGPCGITATVVHPGCTDTDMNPAEGPDAAAELGFIALGHYGTGADLAATVAHLAGEGGRYITGTSIAVDGGYAA